MSDAPSWHTRWQVWRSKPLCIAATEPSGTWLQLRKRADSSYYAGCSICAAASTDSPWAKFQITNLSQFRFCKVVKHYKSRLHRLAITQSEDVPSDDAWRRILLFQGRTSSKDHAMRWCLNEGLRIVHWQMLLNDGGVRIRLH